MTIHIRVEDFPITQMRFNYSVLHELLISLHVLDDYRSYPLHTHWSLTTLRKLSRGLQQERQYFRMLIATMIFGLWDADAVEESTFELELEQFAAQPLHNFTTLIVSRLIMDQPPEHKTVIEDEMTLEELKFDPIMQEYARSWLVKHFPESDQLLDDLLDDAQAVKERFVAFLQRYWDEHFSEFWEGHEPHFMTDIEDKGKRLVRRGVLDVLKSLSPKMRIQEIVYLAQYVAPGVKDDFTLTERDTLTLHPSYFTYPMLVFTVRKHDDGQTALSITYPMKAVYDVSSAPVMAEELVQILQGLSDQTRLQILRLVAQQPRSTKEIADILNLSQAAISKHLKILKLAGWVTSERDSYYVMYSATKDPLPLLNRGIEDILN